MKEKESAAAAADALAAKLTRNIFIRSLMLLKFNDSRLRLRRCRRRRRHYTVAKKSECGPRGSGTRGIPHKVREDARKPRNQKKKL